MTKKRWLLLYALVFCAVLAGCGTKTEKASDKTEETEELPEFGIETGMAAEASSPVTEESYRVLTRSGAARDVFLQEDISPLVEEAKRKAASAEAAMEVPAADGQEQAASDDEKTQEQEEKTDEEAAETDPDGEGETEAKEETEPASEAPKPASGGGRVVCIDAGHQRKQNSAQEPVGPGASSTKMKVTSGTAGTTTGVPEYQLTLAVAQKLKTVLQQRGYTVVMCRESHDVDISNVERAQVANNAGAGAFIRIHADGANNASAAGASTLAPSASNPYCANISSSSQALAKNVINSYCAKTGMKNRGMQINDGMTGLNWSQVPVTIIEMGFMTNPSDDQLMQTESFQQAAAEGMADGIDAFFAGR